MIRNVMVLAGAIVAFFPSPASPLSGIAQSELSVQYGDLTKKTTEELRLMRNEIFARHGRIFKATDLQQHFSAQPWYKPRVDFNELMLSQEEAILVRRISNLEEEVVARQFSRRIAWCEQSGQIKADLDGDGIPELITVKPVDPTTVAISVGSNTITEGGPDCQVVLSDVDSRDSYKEIIVGDAGPSDDYYSRFYRYSHGQWRQIGKRIGGTPGTATLI